MNLETVQAREVLRDGTRTFVAENPTRLARILEPALRTLEREMRHLTGAEGLLLKRNFLRASEPWEKFFWTRVTEHHLKNGEPLEAAVRLADEDVLLLSSAFGPL